MYESTVRQRTPEETVAEAYKAGFIPIRRIIHIKDFLRAQQQALRSFLGRANVVEEQLLDQDY